MPAAEARVPTDRASRYLTQLCSHGQRMRLSALHRRGARTSHGHVKGHEREPGAVPPQVREARATDTDGVIEFGWGRCVVHASATELVLRAEADSEEGLRRIKDGVAARVERIGRRDRLSVAWSQGSADAG